jgi:glyoxylase-like metal-dependent hydrolase (beta-lactamase superfamily II)
MIYRIEGGYANTYLIEGESGLVAVDVGTTLAAEEIRDIINEQKGVALRLITATHFHIDHIGGIEKLKEFFPDSTVLFSRRVERYLTGEEKLALPPLRRWFTGLIPVVTRIGNQPRNYYQSLTSKKAGIPLPLLRTHITLGYEPRCELAEPLEIPFLPDWKLIETPGHTPDSICFYHREEKILLSGDTVLNMEGTGELNRFCWSIHEIEKSFKKISSFPVETIYPGHGNPIKGVPDALEKVKLFSRKSKI